MEQNSSPSVGRRIWAIAAIVISILVLLLAATATVGVWYGRGIAIEANDTLMDGVYDLSSAGRKGAQRLNERVDEIQGVVSEIESAVDEIAQDVSNKGLILTLLPPEKEQKIIDTADSIAETLDTIRTAIETALDLYRAVNDIPFINMPKPDEKKVQTLSEDILEIQDSVDQLAADIQEFRDGAASAVSKVSAAAGEVNDRLKQTSLDLSNLDSELAEMQTRASNWKIRFRTITAVTALVLTVIFIWSIYGMVVLIIKHWREFEL
ncbi:MAG: hypothetical protein ACK2U3_13760 [Anaerolineales bacterium]